jgi:hypothetical protein
MPFVSVGIDATIKRIGLRFKESIGCFNSSSLEFSKDIWINSYHEPNEKVYNMLLVNHQLMAEISVKIADRFTLLFGYENQINFYSPLPGSWFTWLNVRWRFSNKFTTGLRYEIKI